MRCGVEINKQDKVHHKTEVCEYRRVKCQDCGKMQEVIERFEEKMMELDRKVGEARGETEKEVEEIMNAAKYNGDKVEAMYKEIKTVSRETEQVKKEVGGVKEEVKDVKENLSKVNKDVDEIKVMMSQVLEKLNMLEHLNKLPSPAEGMLNPPREDILIGGGCERLDTKTTEIFSWEKNGWFEMWSRMNEDHDNGSSFIYKDHVFAVGGGNSERIETLDLNDLPLKWRKLPRVLAFKCCDHQTVVCQQTVFHIGGFTNEKLHEWNDKIYELQLASPSISGIMKELCQMPEPRHSHCAEVFEDKVLILGGIFRHGIALDSVFEFDTKRNECKELPNLPVALRRMATVQWRDQVVVLGGQDKDNKAVDDVFMYDIKTGKITVLPSMLEKRFGCCAVITGDTIVVMGGVNEEGALLGEDLNSVECFTMGSSTWEYLPAMTKTRYCALAEVLPSGRKYV